MRIELFEVHFNNSNSIYIGGQTVSGKVVVKLNKATRIDSIYINFTGRAKSKWEVSQGESSKQYKATEVYIDSEHHLYRSQGNDDLQPAGLHMYPFDFVLPQDVPSSFVGRRGFVRYMCLVTLDRGWKGVLQIEQDLTVIRHLDLNTVPYAATPQHLWEEAVYEGCCCDSGDVTAELRMPKSGYVPGEPLIYNLVVNNKATSSICGFVMCLEQMVEYTGFSDSLFSSGNPKYHVKVNRWTLMQAEDEIAPGRSSTYSEHCVIPAVAPSLLEGCNIINITYELHIEIPMGWKTIDMACQVYIGTIPLRQETIAAAQPVRDTNNSSVEPPTRQVFDSPPSYEECVFGRMESQEAPQGQPDVDDDEDDVGARATSSTAARRSRMHRMPSYPYYTFGITASNGHTASNDGASMAIATPLSSTATRTSNYNPTAPPIVASDHQGYTPLPITEQPTSSSLPPPPSYESLGFDG